MGLDCGHWHLVQLLRLWAGLDNGVSERNAVYCLTA